MKTLFKFSSLMVMFAVFSSCDDTVKETYQVNDPIYMSYEDLRESFNVKSGEEIKVPGKIYFKNKYIYVNEFRKGIHIIDNSDPASPEIIKFIEIPGNVDMAIKGNVLYADSYVDLLSIDISDVNNIKEIDRDENALQYIIPDVENGIIKEVDQVKGVITGYNVTTVTEKVEDNSGNFIRFWGGGMMEDVAFASSPNKTNFVAGDAVGIGGSMARFAIYENYLYTVNESNMKLFNITSLGNPKYEQDIYIDWWRIETIFPYEDKMFIGGQAGMYVYDVSNPGNPVELSRFTHASACDPVVVEGDYAYVTLRGGNLCGAISSQLDVIDISDITNPELLKVYPLTDPYGLGIDDDVLFICDGDAGLKIYDASDKEAIDNNMIASYPDMDAFDVIPLGNVLILIGEDGLYQYNYSSLENITLLSHIKISF